MAEKEPRRILMFPISTDVRASVQALYGFLDCLPKDAHIVAIRNDPTSPDVAIFVESSFFPPLKYGNIADRVPLWVMRMLNETGEYVETAEWRWCR